MGISAMPSGDGKTLTIKISDRFDFNLHSELRRLYYQPDKRYQSYIVDLKDTTYMDSSALGMLLQLRDFAGGRREAVRVTRAQAAIKEILAVANFHQLMTVD